MNSANKGSEWLKITRGLQVLLPCGPVDWGKVEFRLKHSPGLSICRFLFSLRSSFPSTSIYDDGTIYRRLVNSFFKNLFVHTAVDWIVQVIYWSEEIT